MAIVVGIKKTTKFQKQPSDNLLMPALCVGISKLYGLLGAWSYLLILGVIPRFRVYYSSLLSTTVKYTLMRTLLMLCLIALITGCNGDNPQCKAEKLINRYLENNLKDPDSYECIDMGKIGIVTPMSKALVETVKRATDGEFPTDSINSKLEQIKAMFESNDINPYDTLAWEISHRYRAKNSYGGYAITNCTYHFNKDISDIISVETK